MKRTEFSYGVLLTAAFIICGVCLSGGSLDVAVAEDPAGPTNTGNCHESGHLTEGRPTACTGPEDKDCTPDIKDIPISFTAGGEFFIQASGGVTYPFEIPKGCKGNGPHLDLQICPMENEAALEFMSAPGDTKELQIWTCPERAVYVCEEPAYTTSIGLTDEQIAAIAQLLGLDPSNMPDGFALTVQWPARKCTSANETPASSSPQQCYDSQGGSPSYKKEGEACD